MRRSASGLRSRRRAWFGLACCSALFACGASSSHGRDVKADAVAGNAGSTDDGLVLARAGAYGDTTGNGGSPAMLQGGAAGPLPHDTVGLCLYPEQIPDNWSAGAGTSSQTCALGQLGEFIFDGCRYELLDVTAYDVDPFRGGHSRCCYRSVLIACP